jgi:hypothetical protein
VSCHPGSRFARQILACLVLTLSASLPAAAQVSVTTYHYDNYRTGWNSAETTLTPTAVHSKAFGILGSVTLDDKAEAQPLVVSGVSVTVGRFKGVHDVVYVATENNSIYAINVTNGNVLLKVNFGPPVVNAISCGRTGGNVGISSTPVIDLSSNTLYVVVYTQDPAGPTYRIHALDLGSLTDKVTPQVITATHTLSDGTTYSFNPTYQRQRPGLLLANGNIYAGFGSFCGSSPSMARGWLMGWQTGYLTPLPGNSLTDMLATSPNNYYLASIWMSGYGLASDDSGNILFVTGNSDPSGTTYDGVTSIQQSTIKVSPDLATVLDLFTPSNVSYLDQHDLDFGSGGVMVLPDQPGSIPHLAVAAGKSGSMFFMNEDDLGGFSTASNNVLGTYTIDPCWCGESYFVDPKDNAARVVSSGGGKILVWKLLTSPTTSLAPATSSPTLNTLGNGFFTSVSSNGTADPVIWALTRPVGAETTINLYAFAPDMGGKNMTQLFTGAAGTWIPNSTNSNLVPVVANGRVFVSSYKQLTILGLRAKGIK